MAVGSSYDFNDNSLGIRYEFRRTPSDKYDTRNIIETNVTSVSQNLSSTSEKFSQSSRHSLNSYAVFKFGKMKIMNLLQMLIMSIICPPILLM